MDPLGCQRDAFDLPDDRVWLNAAYLTPLPNAVRAGIESGVERQLRPWDVAPPDFFDPVDALRRAAAGLLGGDADGWAVIPAVSYGIATVAANLPLAAGDEIVVLDEQFPSNWYAWHDSAAAAGARLVTVPRGEGGDWTSGVLAAIGPSTAIVALPTCHWTDGTAVDLVAVGEAARRVGARLVVDGSQSLGAVPFDLAAVRPDALVTCGYKWLLGPYALGYLWVAEDLRAGRPLERSWMARDGSDDFAGLVAYRDGYRPGARRYDVGETSNFTVVPGARAALDLLAGWGVERVAAHVRTLTDRIAAGAEDLGLAVAAPAHRSPHLVGVRLGGADPRQVAATLAEARVHVSVRGDAVRVGPHVYNDEADVDRFLEALAAGLG